MSQVKLQLAVLGGRGPNSLSPENLAELQVVALKGELLVEFGTVRQFGHQHWSQRAERTVTIDTKNVCARITDLNVDGSTGAIIGTVEAYGPKRKLVKQTIERGLADRLVFGIRGVTTPQGMKAVTFDLIRF